jgi:copper(I)-binding protein
MSYIYLNHTILYFRAFSNKELKVNKYISLILLTVAIFLTIINPIQAHDHNGATKVGDLIISNIWARVTPQASKTGAAFFIIKNKSKTDDTLVDVSSKIAKRTEIHKTSMKDNIMKMRHVGKIVVPAGGVAELKPNSFHIMFMGLHSPIKHEDIFPLTLTFKTAGAVKIMVKASKLAEKTPMVHGKMKTK